MKISYFILNNFDYDSRARLEVATLGAIGYNVEIIATTGSESESYIGYPIHRIPQWRFPTRKFRFLQYNYLAARAGKRIKADICHAVDLDTLQAAVWASQANCARVVYEARELYTELEAVSGRPRIQAIWRNLETRLINKADKVITINESIADELCKRYAISRPDIIRNVAPLLKAARKADLSLLFGFPANWKLLIYQGVLRKGQGLIELLHIMSSIDDGIGLLIIGDGPIEEELKSLVKEFHLAGRVKFAGRVNPDMLASFTSGADAGALLMEDVALNNKLALPQKLFQYLAAGIPQIVSPMPEIAAFVEREKTGITVPLNNSPKSARMISEFLSNHAALALCKANCSKSAELNNWEIESRRLVELYRILEHKK